MASKILPVCNILGYTFDAGFCQEYKAIDISTQLIYPNSEMSAVYDGDDSIYLFGGVNKGNRIFKFSITNGTLTAEAKFTQSFLSAAFWDGGSLVKFGGLSIHNKPVDEIQRYIPGESSIPSGGMGNLPLPKASTCVVPLQQVGYALLFGGRVKDGDGNTILKYFNNVAEVQRERLPFAVESPLCYRYSNVVYIFGGCQNYPKSVVLSYDISSRSITILKERAPKDGLGSSLFYTNQAAYITGWNSLVKFSPGNKKFSALVADNLELHSPGVVFVGKINRAYIFGENNGTSLLKNIKYLDVY